MELEVYSKDGVATGRKVNVSDEMFAAEVNDHAVYLTVQSYLTNNRQGTVATKTRSMVSGGGKKPWKQKGRGTARSGSSRSPIWRGGGKVHGPQPHPYFYKVSKKIKSIAKASALTGKCKDEQIKVVEDFKLETAKTRQVFSVLKSFGLHNDKTLVLVPDYDSTMLLAGRNIKNLKILMAQDASVYDLLNCKTLLVMESAIKKLEGVK
ncbi:MAG TPA: 50S ribosomal protein L4 [bacterium]|nr:50S ribosomal protein L4 [bacterium]HPN41912.1 50S ribosomal protein L4 [bacterium]